MEVTVSSGKGYVPAEKNKTEDMPIGTIPIDAIFSPVQQGQLHASRRRASAARPTSTGSRSRSGPTARSRPRTRSPSRRRSSRSSSRSSSTSRSRPSRSRRSPRSRLAAQPEPVPLGGRARAVGALGQLPAEREHPPDRRAGAAHRVGDAQDQELRPQVAQRDQGSARRAWASSLGMRIENFPERSEIDRLRDREA